MCVCVCVCVLPVYYFTVLSNINITSYSKFATLGILLLKCGALYLSPLTFTLFHVLMLVEFEIM